jgi:predicted 2-oxoglutarate/Fe(II)-dependent dioxygenase YbiX
MELYYQKELGLVQFILNRMHAGAENTVHIDNATGMYPELEYSAMIYLNDCGKDFQGGELNFPNQNIELKTKKGMLVFFKGDEKTPHGVNPVSQGYRDNFISFFKSLE